MFSRWKLDIVNNKWHSETPTLKVISVSISDWKPHSKTPPLRLVNPPFTTRKPPPLRLVNPPFQSDFKSGISDWRDENFDSETPFRLDFQSHIFFLFFQPWRRLALPWMNAWPPWWIPSARRVVPAALLPPRAGRPFLVLVCKTFLARQFLYTNTKFNPWMELITFRD